MNVPQQIINRVPSPDTFPSTVSDEEFFLRIPYAILDLLLYAWENKVPMNETCAGLKLSEEQVKRAYRDFSSKFNATNHLRELPPNLL
jgi:NAD+ synthase